MSNDKSDSVNPLRVKLQLHIKCKDSLSAPDARFDSFSECRQQNMNVPWRVFTSGHEMQKKKKQKKISSPIVSALPMQSIEIDCMTIVCDIRVYCVVESMKEIECNARPSTKGRTNDQHVLMLMFDKNDIIKMIAQTREKRSKRPQKKKNMK